MFCQSSLSVPVARHGVTHYAAFHPGGFQLVNGQTCATCETPCHVNNHGNIPSMSARGERNNVLYFNFCTQGDSGSALHCQGDDDDKLVLAGVVSWGRGCAVQGEPGVYTDITTHREWLLQTIQGSPTSGSEATTTNIHVLESKT
jgi:secreted trypsin-like serine protease